MKICLEKAKGNLYLILFISYMIFYSRFINSKISIKIENFKKNDLGLSLQGSQKIFLNNSKKNFSLFKNEIKEKKNNHFPKNFEKINNKLKQISDNHNCQKMKNSTFIDESYLKETKKIKIDKKIDSLTKIIEKIEFINNLTDIFDKNNKLINDHFLIEKEKEIDLNENLTNFENITTNYIINKNISNEAISNNVDKLFPLFSKDKGKNKKINLKNDHINKLNKASEKINKIHEKLHDSKALLKIVNSDPFFNNRSVSFFFIFNLII